MKGTKEESKQEIAPGKEGNTVSFAIIRFCRIFTEGRREEERETCFNSGKSFI